MDSCLNYESTSPSVYRPATSPNICTESAIKDRETARIVGFPNHWRPSDTYEGPLLTAYEGHGHPGGGWGVTGPV